MKQVAALTFIFGLLSLGSFGAETGPVNMEFNHPRRVTIQGYSGSAEEPRFSPDGQYLIFDDRTDEHPNSDIFYAKRIDDTTFTFMGEVRGVNTPQFEEIAGIDDAGNFYFMSTRNYTAPDWNAAYRGVWQDG